MGINYAGDCAWASSGVAARPKLKSVVRLTKSRLWSGVGFIKESDGEGASAHQRNSLWLAELFEQAAQIAAIAAGFTGLLSLFNIAGRFFWASLSDRLGRKAIYAIFFVLGTALYASAPSAGHAGSVALFVGAFCIILSMYGGGFATVPAYLADMFGTQFVGAIHGRLLTAWSMAGIFGPVIVNYLREYQLAQGLAKAQVYDTTMLILAALLVAGFLCNLLIRPVAPKWQMSDEELGAARKLAHEVAPAGTASAAVPASASPVALVLIAWLAVGIPLAWGVAQTVAKAAILFK